MKAIILFRRDIFVTRRNMFAEIGTTLSIPVTMFLTFGIGLRGYIQDVQGVAYLVFLCPGLVAMTALTESFDHGAWSMWFHRKILKTIDAYRVSPITTYDILVGKLLSGFFLGCAKALVVAVSLILLSAWLMPRPFWPSPGHWPLYFLYILLGSSIFSCAGTAVGTLCDRPEQLGRVQMILVQPLILLGGVFFPMSSYPEMVREVTRFIPTTMVFEGSRRALLEGRLDVYSLLGLLVWALVSFGLAARIFDRYIDD